MAITKQDLHALVDELPDTVLVAAEAFLAFLRDRAAPNDPPTGTRRPPDRLDGQDWADGERRGLEQRRWERQAADGDPDADGTA